MEDVQIIDLLFRRDPAALEAVEARYGKKCLASACRILPDRRDAEECVSDGLTWRYRMAATADVTENIPDISQLTGGSETAESAVRWCAARLRWTEGLVSVPFPAKLVLSKCRVV